MRWSSRWLGTNDCTICFARYGKRRFGELSNRRTLTRSNIEQAIGLPCNHGGYCRSRIVGPKKVAHRSVVKNFHWTFSRDLAKNCADDVAVRHARTIQVPDPRHDPWTLQDSEFCVSLDSRVCVSHEHGVVAAMRARRLVPVE